MYSANIFTIAGDAQKRWFIVRKNEKWRLDIYHGDALWRSQIFYGGNLYELDHTDRTVTVRRSPTDSLAATPFGDTIGDNFRGHEHFEFEEIGRDGSIIKYKARSDISKGEIVVSFDTAIKMIVRQEFLEADGSVFFVYELKNFSTEVSDSVFWYSSEYRLKG